MTKYNGWTNFETWHIAMSFENSENFQEHEIFSFENWLEYEQENGTQEEYGNYKNKAIYDLSVALKEEVEYAMEEALNMSELPNWITDLIRIDKVNFYEIAETYIKVD